jgi:SAM-dependent methyltransferase
LNCRFCGSTLQHIFIDLGTAPFSNSFLEEKQLQQPENYYPLRVFVCDSCFLVQTEEYKKSSEIFTDDYVYFSSMSTTWIEHCRHYSEMITERLGLDRCSRVIEIAANDGYLLQFFVKKGIPCFGIEPAKSTAAAARNKGIHIIERFFNSGLADEIAERNETADLVIGNNVLAHVPELNDFVDGVRIVLKPTGTATFEFPHLLRLIEYNQFDTIYHEHFSYFSLGTVSRVFSEHGLAIYDVEEVPTHGGSLRVYAKRSDNEDLLVADRMQELMIRENEMGMRDIGFYLGFKDRVLDAKIDFIGFLLEAKKEHRRVAGYGAAAKGNTLLNFCGIKADLIEYVVDASPSKQGRYLPGSRIPVVKEEVLKRDRPDYVIVFPWNIEHEITEQLRYIRSWGGKFVTAIPTLKVK